MPTCLEYVNRNTLPTTAIEVDNNVNNSNALSLLVVIYPNLLKSINYNGDYDYLKIARWLIKHNQLTSYNYFVLFSKSYHVEV